MEKKPHKLTEKRERFCQEWHATSSKTEALRRSHDTKNMKEATVWNEAYKLSLDPHVAARMAELRAEAAARHHVTIDSLSLELEEARRAGMSLSQISAAVSATVSKAKLHGFLTDKADVNIILNGLASQLDSAIKNDKAADTTHTARNSGDSGTESGGIPS